MFGPPPLRRTLAAALRDLGDGRPRVRAAAVRDLAHHAEASHGDVVAALERCLSDASAEVRGDAALALADVRGVEALASLLVALEDDAPHVRQMAITALGELGDPRARERLRRALGDPRPEVRFQAVIAFGRVAPDEAEAALLAALGDDDPHIRHIALRVAEERADEAGLPIAPALLARARELLADPSPLVHAGAAILLARAGDPLGTALVADVVAGRVHTPEREDEASAIELAGELGLTDMRPFLERRAYGLARFRNETFAWQARVALARMGHARARRDILRGLAAWSRDRRTLAAAAAGRARLLEALPLLEAMRGREAWAEPGAIDEALVLLAAHRDRTAERRAEASALP